MTDAQAPGLGRKRLLRLVLGQVCLHASMSGLRMTAPLLALREGYSAMAVGLLLALFALTQVFLAIPAGRYIDRQGFRLPLAGSVIASVSAAALAMAWPVFPVLCLSALLAGGSTGVATINLQRYVGRSARDSAELKQMFSWLSIGPAMANFIGPLCAGLMIDSAGFRATFFLLALFPVLTWVIAHKTPELAPLNMAVGSVSGRAWDLMHEPAMRRLILVNWLLSACWDVHTFVVPVLGHERGISASVIGSILGGFALSAAAVRVMLPLFAAHMQERKVITGAMMMTALVFLLYPLMPSAFGMLVCSLFLGVSLGSVQPMIMSMLHQITPHHRHGEALGFRLMTINLSSVLMPLLFGSTGALVGVSLVFWVVGGAVGWGSRAASRLPVTAGQSPSEQPTDKNPQ